MQACVSALPYAESTCNLRFISLLSVLQALDEPNFGVTYASMCKCLTVLKVPGSKQGETAVFRKLIITRCQWEFEHGSASEVEVEQKQKAIELAESEEKKKQMKEELEIFESKAKRRSIGNVR